MRITLLLVLVAVFSACQKKDLAEQNMGTDMLNAFHDVMAQSYHPVADSGNLEPAKLRAAELAEVSAQWQAKTVAEAGDTAALSIKLTTLRDSCASFDRAVKAGTPDSTLRKSLTDIHHLFHQIHESARGGHHEEGSEHH
ncbi:MAG: hypothetical protein FJZ78_10715 [Bacteroidetes bacterium]|nr:hypothetical protein [Bacteroidota bacterium]